MSKYIKFSTKEFFLFFLLSVLFYPAVTYCQDIHPVKEKHGGTLELITSGIVGYIPSESRTTFGSETHLTYWWSHKWGGGMSYTARFDDGRTLSDIAILGSMNPTKWLTINAGPNLAIPKDEVRENFHWGLYAETEFNYRVSNFFHFGLLLGSVISEESEYTTGVQFGFEF